MSVFAELFTDTESLVFFVFILVSLSVFVSGGSYADSMLIQGLGLVKLIPLLILKSIAGLGPLYAIASALAFLLFAGKLRESVGMPMYVLITICTIALIIGG